MQIFHNTRHAEHTGRQEMFRGRLVDCHEVPARLQHVLDELARRPLGKLQTPSPDLPLDAALARVHRADYLALLASAWDEWLALDPSNAERDALPSVWPLAQLHAEGRHRELPHHAEHRLEHGHHLRGDAFRQHAAELLGQG